MSILQMKVDKNRWPVFDEAVYASTKTLQDMANSLGPRKDSDMFEEMSGMVTLRKKDKQGRGSHSPSPAVNGHQNRSPARHIIPPPPNIPAPPPPTALTSW